MTPCDDFEIRLYCDCQRDNQSACDPLVPHVEDVEDCRRFYHCVPRDGYTELVQKHCEFGTIFNPKTLICDWPQVVYDLKPACRNPQTDNKVIPCDRVCNSYLYKLRTDDRCASGSDCSGCFNGSMECPGDYFWYDSETCAPIQDCSCVSNYGFIVEVSIKKPKSPFFITDIWSLMSYFKNFLENMGQKFGNILITFAFFSKIVNQSG